MSKAPMIAMSLTLFALAGCGGGAPNANDSSAAPAASEAGAKAAGWAATDACAIIDKAAMSAALKVEVTETKLDLVHEADGQTAATSQCTYTLKDGLPATVMTRWSPIDDNVPASIAQARSGAAATLKAFSDKQIEDVPGLGTAAFFTPTINQLTVFLDKARMIIISLPSAPNAEGKDMAVALAKKAAG